MEMIALLNPEEKQDSLLITIPLHELEEKVQRVIEYLVYKFDVDFVVEDYYQNSIIYSVIEF